MFVRQLVDFLRRKISEDVLRQFAQQRVAQSVKPFEMFEEKNETLEMSGFEFAVDAVKGMRDGVNDLFRLQIALKIENVFAQLRDLIVLRFRNSPREEIYFAGILREVSRDLFADERIRLILQSGDNLRSCRDR